MQRMELLEEQRAKSGMENGSQAVVLPRQPASPVAQVARQSTFRYSAILLMVAATLLVASIFLPYWARMLAPTLHSPLCINGQKG